eukprot:8747373-Ditylum_brightwellii.AAC.2
MRILERTATTTILSTGLPPIFLNEYRTPPEIRSVAHIVLTQNQRNNITYTDCSLDMSRTYDYQ